MSHHTHCAITLGYNACTCRMNDCTICGHPAIDHGDRAIVACAPQAPVSTFARKCDCTGYDNRPKDAA